MMAKIQKQFEHELIGINDLPYYHSRPIEFVYQSTRPVILAQYTWADVPSPLTPTRPILNNALYFFERITIAADIAELDYQANTNTNLQFMLHAESDGQVPLFREPIVAPLYVNQAEYPLLWQSGQGTTDRLLGSFTGIIDQAGNLVGVPDITMTCIIWAREIVDKNYINVVKKQFPELMSESM